MNQKKRSQEKNKFSKLRLHSSSNKSCKSCSPRPQEKISSYFSSVLNETETISNLQNTFEDLSDSDTTILTRLRSAKSVPTTNPELNAGSETPDDISDFTKSKMMKITKKLENKSSNFETNIKNGSKRKSQFVSKSKLNTSQCDTNQEHLQLAIALSKSVLDLENPQDVENAEKTFPSTQEKIKKVKQTLDQFGFKTEKGFTLPNSNTNVKLTKGKKFKCIRPTLFLRTEADRTKLIENKVSEILNNISIYNNTTEEKCISTRNNVDNKPRSFLLRDYYKEELKLFNKNSFCTSDYTFYNSIIVEPYSAEVGVLLKDWLTIPGREATPPLEESVLLDKIEIEDERVNIVQVPIASSQISMSPELFTDSDIDDNTEYTSNNETININNSRKGFLNSTADSITQIDIESNGSTKSVSLLLLNNINMNKNKNKNKNTEQSLSPFPIIEPLRNGALKLKHNLKDDADRNSDSLSPFEYVNKSPQRKVTPKKISPSPKKYVVTPKGRKIISPNNQRKHSPCKRSILFSEQKDCNKSSSSICHYESFSNDSIECFDLTLSDDDVVPLEEANINQTNKSFTITQMLDELSQSKRIDISKEVESAYDSQASIETVKLNIPHLDLAEEFSPELDCLNTSNNKVFYETLNTDNLFNEQERNKTNLSLKEISELINKEHEIKTPLINKEIQFFSSNGPSLRRSYSENFIDNKEFEKASTPISKTYSETGSINEIEKNDLDFPTTSRIFLSQSSISTCSEISDEELNYSCNKKYDLSEEVVEISDDEDASINVSKCNFQLCESGNNVNKSLLQHPRITKLSTPIKVMKTVNVEMASVEVGDADSTASTPITDFIISTDNITPKGNYSDMDTPERNQELDKYGLKPMKRNKGVKILHYIYDSTHPYVNKSNDGKLFNNSSDDENGKATKRRKTNSNENYSSLDVHSFGNMEQNQIAESEKVEDMIFERKQSSKISSCRLPLHVAWHNLLINSKELQENILTYRPIQVEEIYQQFKNFGYKFHIQDVIAFFDKKCITIRIAQNNRHQRKANSIK